MDGWGNEHLQDIAFRIGPMLTIIHSPTKYLQNFSETPCSYLINSTLTHSSLHSTVDRRLSFSRVYLQISWRIILIPCCCYCALSRHRPASPFADHHQSHERVSRCFASVISVPALRLLDQITIISYLLSNAVSAPLIYGQQQVRGDNANVFLSSKMNVHFTCNCVDDDGQPPNK